MPQLLRPRLFSLQTMQRSLMCQLQHKLLVLWGLWSFVSRWLRRNLRIVWRFRLMRIMWGQWKMSELHARIQIRLALKQMHRLQRYSRMQDVRWFSLQKLQSWLLPEHLEWKLWKMWFENAPLFLMLGFQHLPNLPAKCFITRKWKLQMQDW